MGKEGGAVRVSWKFFLRRMCAVEVVAVEEECEGLSKCSDFIGGTQGSVMNNGQVVTIFL